MTIQPGTLFIADMIDYKALNKSRLRYMLRNIDNFSKHTRTIPLEKALILTDEFPNIISTSKRKPIERM